MEFVLWNIELLSFVASMKQLLQLAILLRHTL